MQIIYFRLHFGREINLKRFYKNWGSHSAAAENQIFVKPSALSLGKYVLRIE